MTSSRSSAPATSTAASHDPPAPGTVDRHCRSVDGVDRRHGDRRADSGVDRRGSQPESHPYGIAIVQWNHASVANINAIANTIARTNANHNASDPDRSRRLPTPDITASTSTNATTNSTPNSTTNAHSESKPSSKSIAFTGADHSTDSQSVRGRGQPRALPAGAEQDAQTQQTVDLRRPVLGLALDLPFHERCL
jgi:hypothetical protein